MTGIDAMDYCGLLVGVVSLFFFFFFPSKQYKEYDDSKQTGRRTGKKIINLFP